MYSLMTAALCVSHAEAMRSSSEVDVVKLLDHPNLQKFVKEGHVQLRRHNRYSETDCIVDPDGKQDAWWGGSYGPEYPVKRDKNDEYRITHRGKHKLIGLTVVLTKTSHDRHESGEETETAVDEACMQQMQAWAKHIQDTRDMECAKISTVFALVELGCIKELANFTDETEAKALFEGLVEEIAKFVRQAQDSSSILMKRLSDLSEAGPVEELCLGFRRGSDEMKSALEKVSRGSLPIGIIQAIEMLKKEDSEYKKYFEDIECKCFMTTRCHEEYFAEMEDLKDFGVSKKQKRHDDLPTLETYQRALEYSVDATKDDKKPRRRLLQMRETQKNQHMK